MEIPVVAKNADGQEVSASAYTVVGAKKEELLEAIVSSELIHQISVS